MYKTQGRPSAAAADPYDAVREAMGKGRRQELFSFAAAQLLVMGTPERAALLLRCGGSLGAAWWVARRWRRAQRRWRVGCWAAELRLPHPPQLLRCSPCPPATARAARTPGRG